MKFLSNISSGKLDTFHRVLLSGVQGVGKSTFAMGAPKPIFLDPHGGTDRLDVERLEEPEGGWSWDDLIEAITELTELDHEYYTLVIDELGRWQTLCWRHVCRKHGKRTIEDWGFRKGYLLALDEWNHLTSKLDKLREKMNIILISHSHVKTYKNPEGPDWDRYIPDLDERAGSLLKRWCDTVLFAHFDSTAAKKNSGRSIGITGPRVIETTYSAAWDAKNRDGLPPQMPLDYEEFARAIELSQPDNPEETEEAIKSLFPRLSDGQVKWAEKELKKASGDAQILVRILNWATGKAKPEEENSND